MTYGPLLNRATQVVFEGVPTYPDAGRCWQIVDKYQVPGKLWQQSCTCCGWLKGAGRADTLTVLFCCFSVCWCGVL
jgi:acyl-coenzyme A synthetase/AMP-(fatty) acid ligase